jgi:hypothetical protein
MNRSLDVIIESGSWEPASVPAELSTLGGTRQVNVFHALLFTALWTRPPQVYGFHLNDLWAWHRYHPAIAGTDDLRLREEWRSVDPHQKTILSDEFGIGFTTLLIQESFHCGEFADTLYVVNVLEPNSFRLTSAARVGSQKSPDYIARLQGSERLILECKGTQSSRAALKKAIARGIDQKKSLKAQGSTSIKHSLVAGLYIPQWDSAETACISVADPFWEELERFLSGQLKERVDEAITQVSLAKQLALCGLAATPDYLISARAGELKDLPENVQLELKGLPSEGFRIVFDSSDLRSRQRDSEAHPRLVLLARVPEDLHDRLIGDDSVSGIISDLSKRDPAAWRMASGESFAEISTPSGFSFRLEVGSAQSTRKVDGLRRH